MYGKAAKEPRAKESPRESTREQSVQNIVAGLLLVYPGMKNSGDQKGKTVGYMHF